MNYEELKNTINDMNSNWEQFKVVNDRRISAIEQKGSASADDTGAIMKLNDEIDKCNQRIKKFESSLNRPQTSILAEESDDGYQKAFCQYIRKGFTSGAIEQKNYTSDAESGYLLTSTMMDYINDSIIAGSPLRQHASVTEVSTDGLELLDDRTSTYTGWTGEETGDYKTSDLKLTRMLIPVHEIYAQPKVTQKLLDDPRVNIENWLSMKLSDVFAKQENIAFITGDGKAKPQGILSYKEGNGVNEITRTKVSKAITAESILNLFYSLPEAYALKGKFMMSRSALHQIRALKDSNGQYLWKPGLDATTADTLLGAEVIQSADMPEAKVGNEPVVFADFKKAYQIVDRHNIRVLRDPFTNKPYVKFYSTKKIGGAVVNFSAVKILKVVS